MVWRNSEQLPEELIFRVNYLGGDMPTFTLNFSRPGSQVVGQYYNFLRLGRAGYTQVMKTLSETARWFSDQLRRSKHFDVISDGAKMPVVAFKLKKDFGYTVFDVSAALRTYGWQVPAYTMPEGPKTSRCCGWWCARGFPPIWPARSGRICTPSSSTWTPSSPKDTSSRNTSRTDCPPETGLWRRTADRLWDNRAW